MNMQVCYMVICYSNASAFSSFNNSEMESYYCL